MTMTRNELIAYVAERIEDDLREPQHASAIAGHAIDSHDWSHGGNIEIRGFKTKTGNPVTVYIDECDRPEGALDEFDASQTMARS